MTTYSISNNILHHNGSPIPQILNTHDKTSHGNNICDYVIIHFTAGPSLKSAHNTFLGDGQVSWHLTVDLDGSVYQLYDFRKITWHAGKSSWIRNGIELNGMNKYSIGIEFVNPGQLVYNGHEYKTWYGESIPKNEVFTDSHGMFWKKFTNEQIATALEIVPVICKQYHCLDVLGHNEISPGRKVDPGPAAYDMMKQLKQLCKDQQ